MDTLTEIQQWYHSQCDEEWEHRYGVLIETLDNPGWLVKIDLAGTPLASSSFGLVEDLEPEQDWISCKIEEKQFKGAGGPYMLRKILDTFLDWARTIENEKDAPTP